MRVVLGIALLAAATAPPADEPGNGLTTDPFRKPVFEAIPAIEVPQDLIAELNEPAALPELRGILRSPRATIVNLDGELVAIGGRFERFTVVAVGERKAVLFDGKEQHVVSIDETSEKPDAKPYP